MTSPKQSTNRMEGTTAVGPSPKRVKTLRNGRKKCVSKRPSAIRDWPLNFNAAAEADLAPKAEVGVDPKVAEKREPHYMTISDDELKSINRTVDPQSSPEYTPVSPPSKAPTNTRLPFEDDAFSPGLYKSSRSPVTIGDSAIQNTTVARGIMLTGMLPRDRRCYDQMTDIDQALDRAAQLHFA
ncbi:hypothetical protein MKW92_044342, partial [Papaver armeniacum]